MAHFYLAQGLQAEHCAIGAEVSFGGSEAKHAAQVSRIRHGESLAVGNGAGLVVHGTVSRASVQAVSLRVERVQQSERPAVRLALAQALAKGGRDELAIQAATELGADAVIPWAADRSISRWSGEKVAKGALRWSSIVREATKQSMRPWVPDVGELVTSVELAGLASTHRMLVLEPTAAKQLSAFEPDETGTGRGILLVVGPEGGIAPAEIERFVAAGGERVRLGDTVLRTSTAGPAAIAVLNIRLGRW